MIILVKVSKHDNLDYAGITCYTQLSSQGMS